MLLYQGSYAEVDPDRMFGQYPGLEEKYSAALPKVLHLVGMLRIEVPSLADDVTLHIERNTSHAYANDGRTQVPGMSYVVAMQVPVGRLRPEEPWHDYVIGWKHGNGYRSLWFETNFTVRCNDGKEFYGHSSVAVGMWPGWGEFYNSRSNQPRFYITTNGAFSFFPSFAEMCNIAQALKEVEGRIALEERMRRVVTDEILRTRTHEG